MRNLITIDESGWEPANKEAPFEVNLDQSNRVLVYAKRTASGVEIKAVIQEWHEDTDPHCKPGVDEQDTLSDDD